jgi:hypothetical protein
MFIGKATEAFVSAVTSTPGKESFEDRRTWGTAVAGLLALIIIVVLIAFLGKWLWNNSMVPLVSVARPATSAWQILGLFVLLGLLFPNAA